MLISIIILSILILHLSHPFPFYSCLYFTCCIRRLAYYFVMMLDFSNNRFKWQIMTLSIELSEKFYNKYCLYHSLKMLYVNAPAFFERHCSLQCQKLRSGSEAVSYPFGPSDEIGVWIWPSTLAYGGLQWNGQMGIPQPEFRQVTHPRPKMRARNLNVCSR